MAFLSQEQLNRLGFKYLGRNVKISDRASIYNFELIEIGDNSRIDDFCLLSGRITIGRNVHIAAFCNIAGGAPGVFLDDFSGLAYGCHIFSQSDDYSGASMTNPTVPKKYKREFFKAVKIGKHSIVGTNSIILPGADLAEGTSIGAMSMVSKATQPWGIYFGVPAHRIKDRSMDLLKLELQYRSEEENDSL